MQTYLDALHCLRSVGKRYACFAQTSRRHLSASSGCGSLYAPLSARGLLIAFATHDTGYEHIVCSSDFSQRVMTASFGSSWQSNFTHFDPVPFAAASLGQVHTGILAPHVSPSGKAEPVAIKVRFPNIENSIRSDLGYLRLLLTASSILPKGLFLDKTLNVRVLSPVTVTTIIITCVVDHGSGARRRMRLSKRSAFPPSFWYAREIGK